MCFNCFAIFVWIEERNGLRKIGEKRSGEIRRGKKRGEG
jgi:hypothetical protein